MRMLNNFHPRPPRTIYNLRDMVDASAARFGDKVLYNYYEHRVLRTYSYNELKRNIDRIGTAFAKLGLAGRHIAVIGEHNPFYVTTYLAAANLGSVIVPLDKELAPERVADFAEFAEVSAIVYSSCFNGRLLPLADAMPHTEYFIPITPDEGEQDERVLPMDALLALGEAELQAGNRAYLDHRVDMDAVCAILFTSGTTGSSKGVMLTQRNLTTAINAACQTTPYDDSNRFVSVLPPHHTYEMTCGELCVINLGGEILINDSLKRVMKNFSSYRPNALILVPLFLETMHKRIWEEIRKQGMEWQVRAAMKANALLLDMGVDIRHKLFGRITAAFGGELKSIVCGGAPIDPEIIRDFYQFGITVLEGYGITECSPLISVNRAGKMRLHSVGTPVPGCTVRVEYDEGQRTGEIVVRGDNVMRGYYKNEEATAAVFTEDGYFRTGDIGYMDKDGYIFITGRKKNVIILSNGKNVFPEELEEYLSKIPMISESVVVGRKSKEDSNTEVSITAIVVPDMEHPSLAGKSAEEVYSLVREAVVAVNKKLPSFKHMTDIELRFEPFEKNSSKKIIRYKIK